MVNMIAGIVSQWMVDVDTNVWEVLVLTVVAAFGLFEIFKLVAPPVWHDSFSVLIQVYENLSGETRRLKKAHSKNIQEQETKADVSILLSEEQIERIRARKWKEVLAWIAFHPDELLRVDRKNRSALHFACLVQAPVQVIEMMLFQAPSLASICNDDNELPLHWAVRLSASKEIIKWLLIVNPASGCCARDKEGNTPLSLTWERHENALMNAFWRQRDTIEDDYGWRRVLFFLKAYALSLDHNQEAIQDLVDIDHTNDLSTDLTQPLHLACRCQACPSTLFSFLMVLHQDNLQCKDENGFLPLHNACLDFQSNRSVGALTKIDLLLNQWSEAASIPASDGRIALFVAIEGGVALDEGINRLIDTVPKSLQYIDPLTSLPAFSLAAVGSRQDENESEQDDAPSRQLSLIYTLLRKDPAMLDRASQRTASP
jgi:hypothetical protein